ncbi:hypothetical protein RP20_CCG016988 [Aedes albopictus]|nr:hypothetical protein RP20_CCG016988 [Aedes albopictus]
MTPQWVKCRLELFGGVLVQRSNKICYGGYGTFRFEVSVHCGLPTVRRDDHVPVVRSVKGGLG